MRLAWTETGLDTQQNGNASQNTLKVRINLLLLCTVYRILIHETRSTPPVPLICAVRVYLYICEPQTHRPTFFMSLTLSGASQKQLSSRLPRQRSRHERNPLYQLHDCSKLISSGAEPAASSSRPLTRPGLDRAARTVVSNTTTA